MCWWVISPFCDFCSLDVSLAVNLCINWCFLHLHELMTYIQFANLFALILFATDECFDVWTCRTKPRISTEQLIRVSCLTMWGGRSPEFAGWTKTSYIHLVLYRTNIERVKVIDTEFYLAASIARATNNFWEITHSLTSRPSSMRVGDSLLLS